MPTKKSRDEEKEKDDKHDPIPRSVPLPATPHVPQRTSLQASLSSLSLFVSVLEGLSDRLAANVTAQPATVL